MLRKKRTITVNETATLLSLSLKSNAMRRDWCTECAAEVAWIELPTVIDFFRLTEKCAVHLSDGRVCSRSLMEQIKTTKIKKEDLT